MYGTVAGVREATGVTSDALGVDDLDATLERFLDRASTMVDEHVGRGGFDAQVEAGVLDEVPKIAHVVTEEIAANMVALAIERRTSGITRADDWSTQQAQSDVFPAHLKAMLRRRRGQQTQGIAAIRVSRPHWSRDDEDDDDA